MNRPPLLWRLLAYAALGVASIIALFPVYAVVVMAVSRAPGFSAVVTPDWANLTLDHLRTFVSTHDAQGRWLFGRQLINSLIVAGAATGVGLLFAASAGYAFSRFKFPGHRLGMVGFFVTQMFPGTMMIVPLYLIANHLGLVDTVVGLVFVYATTSLPFCVWTLKGYFDTIPIDIDEAALIDGASRVRTFYQVLLPLVRPALAVTALFSFLGAWNEFVLAATFLSREEKFTLPVTLYRHVGAYGADWGAFAAGSIVVSLPVCILFLTLQRHLVGGLSSGAVK